MHTYTYIVESFRTEVGWVLGKDVIVDLGVAWKEDI